MSRLKMISEAGSNEAGEYVAAQWVPMTWQEEYEEDRVKHGLRDLVPINVKYPDEDVCVNKAVRMLFENGETDFSKVMWRMSSGSRSRAFDLAQRIMAFKYSLILDEITFDCACAEITGGCEVEWLTE